MASKPTKYKSKVDYEKFKTVTIILLILIICGMGFGWFWQNNKMSENAANSEEAVETEVIEVTEE